MEVDHVISLRELDVRSAEDVQLWRSIAMWDPMLRKDNLSKGSGKHSICFDSDNPESKRYLHNGSRRIVNSEPTDLMQRKHWVESRKKAFTETRGMECNCGVCAAKRGEDWDKQKEDVDKWLKSLIYMDGLFEFFMQSPGEVGLCAVHHVLC